MELANMLLFVTCVSAVGLCMGQPVPTETYPHQAVLDPGSQVKLYWNFNSSHIKFELHGKTTGWIGMGISPSGGMRNADMYVGWVKNGEAHITDRHGEPDSNTFPPKDSEENVKLISGSEYNGWTVIKFERQIAACTGSDDITITSDTLKIIWARGESDPTGNDITLSNYHGNGAEDRGTKNLLLLEGPVEPENLGNEENLLTFDLLNDNFLVPESDTYYNCRLMRFPILTGKHHVVKVEPIIQPGHEAHVHHILVYQCSYDQLRDEELLNGDVECGGPDMPPDFQACRDVIQGWAVGGEAFYYPDHVGFPIGTPGDPKYVIMEVHYDNPGARAGIVDSSGLRYTYTANTRQHDAAILSVGHTVLPYFHIIPPNAESFKQYGECNAGCMQAAMEENQQSDIKIFAVMLHTHLLGRKLTLRHVTDNGTELPYIAQDNNYDFNYQEGRLLQNEVTFNSGDTMQLVCEYNSKSRSTLTRGGLGTRQEMCLAYVTYYPKLPISNCLSFPLPEQLYRAFDVTAYRIDPLNYRHGTLDDVIAEAPAELVNLTLSSIINSHPWSEEDVDALSDGLLQMWNRYTCQTSRTLTSQFPQYGPPLTISQEYSPPEVSCVRPNTGMPTPGPVDDGDCSAASLLTAVYSTVVLATLLTAMATIYA